MSYAWDIAIPANTLATAPVERDLKFHPGVLVKAEFKFPSGCHSMVQVRLYLGEFQLFPLSRGEWVTGDDEPVSFPAYQKILKEPAQLKFRGASPGTTYSHTITVRLTVLPERVASWVPMLELLTKLLQRLGVV